MIHKKKVLFVFGTRPEAIKMAPVISEVKRHLDLFEPVIVVTGQHREMLDQVLKTFRLSPDYDLMIMEEEQTISAVVCRCLQGLEEAIIRERPDIILVQGDTSTAFASSLAAFYQHVPLGHIEAGLRTGKKYYPFPEEMNRRLTSAVADIHFAPTQMAVKNLLSEGINRSSVYLTGNTVIDALQRVAKKEFSLKHAGIDIKEKSKKLILVTVHRRESFGAPLRNICEAVRKIALKHKNIATVILPVHKNPMVSGTVHDILGDAANVQLITPLDYEPFVHLMKISHIILTDSGGIQEEAPSLGKPVLVLREETERPEAVMANTVKVVGTNTDNIVNEVEKLLSSSNEYAKMSKAVNPYGDGKASERIVSALLHYFGFIDVRPEEFNMKEDAKYVKG
ncbi:MAG: UDP-N-acetylglucosamine 2-epimerase (non-hydrolyzing) [bacterium]